MVKIGILTFHKSINNGAFLQCFSLANRIQADFPQTKVEVIDYATQRVFNNYDYSLMGYFLELKAILKNHGFMTMSKALIIKLVNLIKNPKYLEQLRKRTEAFKSTWSQLPLSAYSDITDDYLKAFNDIQGIYNLIIVGSDCVWEYLTYPFPNIYFLNGLSDVVKMSYAATSDRMHYDKISDSDKKYIDESMKQFSYVGIRDIATQNFLYAINERIHLHHNCDPTILLDIESYDVDLHTIKARLQKAGIDFSKPVICIMGDDSIGKLVRELFADKFSIVAVYDPCQYADYYLYDITPLEWSKVFSLFSITFTRYFHGTILSLKNGVPTITLDAWKMDDELHKTKIKDLYDRLDLNEHYFMLKKIYSEAEKVLIKERAISYISNPPKEKIKLALEKEALSYFDFKDALSKVINEVALHD